jgi:hypothetical protein
MVDFDKIEKQLLSNLSTPVGVPSSQDQYLRCLNEIEK